jgi:ATP-dependent helicase/nuclease subunit B
MPLPLTPARSVFVSPSGALRQERALAWLERRAKGAEVLIVGETQDVADHLAREAGRRRGATFGWHRFTLARLAGTLAAPVLADRGLVVASALALEALCARVVRRGMGNLGRFEAVAERPGFPRALARTLAELRLAELGPPDVPDAELGRLLEAYEIELADAKLADRASVLALAASLALERGGALFGLPLLLADVRVGSVRERIFVAALAQRAPEALVTIPEGDALTLDHVVAAMPRVGVEHAAPDRSTALGRLQAHIFSGESTYGTADESVTLLSAPGESRECVEIARAILRHARSGVPFDRIAVLLRSPQLYRAHLEEALRRAEIPACFARGSVRPDPAGRALLALLACKAEDLSARRFAEYLSLGEVPPATSDGAPPAALPSADRYTPPDEEALPRGLAEASGEEAPSLDAIVDERIAEEPERNPVVAGTLRAPRLWERLMVEAQVIGTLDRWKRRLDALEHELRADLAHEEDQDGPHARAIAANLSALGALRDYSLPLLEELSQLPSYATWGEWVERLGGLATRALRRPERVLAVLAELWPMADVGPVTLADVRLALERRLLDLVEPPPKRRAGSVYIAPIESARGLVFDVVFVPGVAERILPQKVSEDPLLLDRVRAQVKELRTNAERTAEERLMLRLAVGAARRAVCLSYPRLDVHQARPRTPSFYALEVLRAAEGRLPSFGELSARAEQGGAARIGWPAPSRPHDAIDEAEHDLALLDEALRLPEDAALGRARYLLSANAHLARALRSRGRRWNVRAFHREDGLVDPIPAARAALLPHRITERSFSPTALQNYAACPYRFYLYAVLKLAPRDEPDFLEELDPLQKGSLVHDVQFRFYGRLREKGLLPVTAATMDEARAILDRSVDEVAREYEEELAPAIARVWEDGIAQIRADLRELLRRSVEEDADWTPVHFELSFGLKDRRAEDPASRADDVRLDCGLRLRGSIDLVERRADGALRATDYKTGKVKAKKNTTVIGGGEVLQPVLYALALERLLEGTRVIEGRLYYCTSAGGFEKVDIALDGRARESAALVAKTVGDALEAAFLPAAPAEGACTFCDYQRICGPYEETRVSKHKDPRRLVPLATLRAKP